MKNEKGNRKQRFGKEHHRKGSWQANPATEGWLSIWKLTFPDQRFQRTAVGFQQNTEKTACQANS